jgi:hypothetical protein
MKVEVIYGTILFPDDFTAVVQEVKKREYVECDTEDDCMEVAEWNASFYGGDWLIPELFHNGEVLYETDDDDEPSICSACNGSGEGFSDGTRCHKCKGRGEA